MCPLPCADASRRPPGPDSATHQPLLKKALPDMASRPSVLFVCIHNAGRSQMAAGFLRSLGGDAIEVRSAGSDPGEQVNPAAVEAMAEVGIDISDQTPKMLTHEAVETSDVVITMGCGDACPVFGHQLPGLETGGPGRQRGIGRCARSAMRSRLGCKPRSPSSCPRTPPASRGDERHRRCCSSVSPTAAKSQMAAGLMRQLAGDRIEVHSAGTDQARP